MRLSVVALALACLAGCAAPDSESHFSNMDYASKVADYVPVKLEADVSGLSKNQRAMLALFVNASHYIDDLFWRQAYGDWDYLLESIDDPYARQFTIINYGPWDRLDGNKPFLSGFGPKPLGANFYPDNITKEEVEEAAKTRPELLGQYSLVRRKLTLGSRDLIAVPYNEAYGGFLARAASLLREAAQYAENAKFRRYLKLRATALETDEYQPSDMAWMDLRDNDIDLVIGPIESYEDKLFGIKTAFEAYVLVKDKEWSARLEKYASMLPALQDALPVPARYKSEEIGDNSQLNVYDVVYFAGDCNAGAKTIAINLPNDEEVQLKKGSRRLQLKNAMRAKFDSILLPIASVLIAEDQRSKINFDAFFTNTMFHEVAHGLGIKRTLDGRGTVRDALREAASALEEAKADILGLHLVGRLTDAGEIPNADLEGNYITFLAGIFRSIRFGTATAHGTANLLTFNYFEKAGAFSRDTATGTYRVNSKEMRAAVDSLSGEILRLQGDGAYGRATRFLADLGRVGEALESDLGRIEAANIPVDVAFDQDWANLQKWAEDTGH